MQVTDLIFIFCFIPASVLVTFFEQSSEYKNFVLIIFSVIFLSWGRPFIICLLFLSVLFDWLFALIAGSKKHKALRASALIADLAMNLSLFVWLEHNNIFSDIDMLSLSDKLIPIGVAFYTLRGFSYVFDCYTAKIQPEKNPCYILTYMTAYPLLIGGPVVRYGDISAQLRERSLTGKKLSDGISRIVIGIAKLSIAAPVLNTVAQVGLNPDELTIFGSWGGMLAYICGICVTWSGVTDVSIGIGNLLGLEFPESFKPFAPSGLVSGLFSSFNITLGKLASDVMVKPAEKKSRVLGVIALPVSVFVTTAWYGVSKGILVAGVVAGVLIIIEELALKKLFGKGGTILKAVSCIYTCIALFFIFAVTRFDSLSGFTHWLKGLIGGAEPYFWGVSMKVLVEQYAYVLIVIAIAYLPFTRKLIADGAKKLSQYSASGYGTVQIIRTLALCILLVLSAISLTSATAVGV